MSKVNWEARNDYEYVNNYKVLQTAFNKLNIEKKAEVEKLCRGKYQDNLEFMQWFKRFFELHQNGTCVPHFAYCCSLACTSTPLRLTGGRSRACPP